MNILDNYEALNDNKSYFLNDYIIEKLVQSHFKIDELFIYNYLSEQNGDFYLFLFTKELIDIKIEFEDNEIYSFNVLQFIHKNDFYKYYSKGQAKIIINYYKKTFGLELDKKLK